jgi:hypothetical protein
MSADMTDLIKTLGVPVALLVAALVTGAREKPLWVFGSVHREAVQRLNVDIANLRNELRELRTQYRDDMAKERALSDSLLGVGERVAAAAEKAAAK